MLCDVCCVLCAVWCVCAVFFAVLSVVSACQFSHTGEEGKGARQTGQTKAPSLGVAVHGSQCLGCFEGQDSRHHCRTRRVGEPLDGFAIAASHDSCSRRLSPVLAMHPLSSTHRACAWPFYLLCFSCSADLKAPSVPHRAAAVAHLPSTVRTSIIQRSRTLGLDTTTSMRASFTVPS